MGKSLMIESGIPRVVEALYSWQNRTDCRALALNWGTGLWGRESLHHLLQSRSHCWALRAATWWTFWHTPTLSTTLKTAISMKGWRVIEYYFRCGFSLNRMMSLTNKGKIIYRASQQECIPFPKTRKCSCILMVYQRTLTWIAERILQKKILIS